MNLDDIIRRHEAPEERPLRGQGKLGRPGEWLPELPAVRPKVVLAGQDRESIVVTVWSRSGDVLVHVSSWGIDEGIVPDSITLLRTEGDVVCDLADYDEHRGEATYLPR